MFRRNCGLWWHSPTHQETDSGSREALERIRKSIRVGRGRRKFFASRYYFVIKLDAS